MSLVLGNRRKAATMVVALGPERAAELLRTLDEADVTAILAEVSALGPVTPEEAAAVLREAAEEIIARRRTKSGGPEMARELLARTVGPDRAAQLNNTLSSASPFRFLLECDPEVAAGALAPEPPPSIALALAHIPPDAASAILGHLPEQIRGEVALRMATLERVTPDVVEAVNRDLEHRLSPLLRTEVAVVPGLQHLVAALNKTAKPLMSAIIDQIEQLDPETAARIRDSLFVFDDIVVLDDLAIQQVLKTVDTRDLAVALKEANEAVSERILKNLSERARENLLEEIEFLKGVKRSDIEEAQKKVVRVVRQLEDAGTITIDRGDD